MISPPAVPALPSSRVGSCTVTTISSCVGLILRMRCSEADGQGNMRSTHGGSNESPLRRLIQERVMDRHPQNPQNRVLRDLRVGTSATGVGFRCRGGGRWAANAGYHFSEGRAALGGGLEVERSNRAPCFALDLDEQAQGPS